MKSSIAVSEHEIDRRVGSFAALVECSNQIKLAVAPKVREEESARFILRRIAISRLERAVSSPKKDAYVIRSLTNHYIGDAVTVQVTDCKRKRRTNGV